MADKANDEKSELFNASMVGYKMSIIEGYFTDFADTLKQINGYIEANVDASISSAVYGALGDNLINIWNSNSSTFNDFHDNFDTWSQVVAVISANNTRFAVDAQATYRDNIGTLDGVEKARQFVSSNNGIENISERRGFNELDDEAREVLDGAYRAATMKTENNNKYGGKTIKYTDAAGRKVEIYYDEEGILVGRKIDDKYYNNKGVKQDKLPSASAHKKEKEDKIAKAKEEDANRVYKGTYSDDPEIDAKIKALLGDVDDPNSYDPTISNYRNARKDILIIDPDTGETYNRDDTIPMKVGQTKRLIVRLPTNTGMINQVTRTTADPCGSTITKTYSDIDPDPNNVEWVRRSVNHWPEDRSILHTNHFEWVVTATGTGTAKMSQTVEYNTDVSRGENLKAMTRIKFQITS